MYLAGPRVVCVCITYSREAWIKGPAGGRGRDSTRNESGLERERETNMTSRREIPLSVYMQGRREQRHHEKFSVCVVFVLVCVGVRR